MKINKLYYQDKLAIFNRAVTTFLSDGPDAAWGLLKDRYHVDFWQVMNRDEKLRFLQLERELSFRILLEVYDDEPSLAYQKKQKGI